MVMIAWALWCNRNEVYHRGEAKNGKEIAQWAAGYLQEYWSTIEVHEMVGFDIV